VRQVAPRIRGIRSWDLRQYTIYGPFCRIASAPYWGEDALLGKGTFNIGTFHGGQAANIVPPQATASIMIRTVEDRGASRREDAADRRESSYHGDRRGVESADTARRGRAFKLQSFLSAAMRPHLGKHWTTDAYRARFYLDAHTAGEKISKRELLDGIDLYERLVQRLLS
jgi:acetylornithine deacetylase/succinyl-diaminopimelate desuccinylase-like protein